MSTIEANPGVREFIADESTKLLVDLESAQSKKDMAGALIQNKVIEEDVGDVTLNIQEAHEVLNLAIGIAEAKKNKHNISKITIQNDATIKVKNLYSHADDIGVELRDIITALQVIKPYCQTSEQMQQDLNDLKAQPTETTFKERFRKYGQKFVRELNQTYPQYEFKLHMSGGSISIFRYHKPKPGLVKRFLGLLISPWLTEPHCRSYCYEYGCCGDIFFELEWKWDVLTIYHPDFCYTCKESLQTMLNDDLLRKINRFRHCSVKYEYDTKEIN